MVVVYHMCASCFASEFVYAYVFECVCTCVYVIFGMGGGGHTHASVKNTSVKVGG